MSFYGKELDDDPEYQERLKKGLVLPPTPIEHKELPRTAALSAIIFVLGVVFAVVAGFFPEIRTPSTGKPLGMGVFLQMSMLAAAFLILVICRPNVKKALESSVLRAGISAIIVILFPLIRPLGLQPWVSISRVIRSSLGLSASLLLRSWLLRQQLYERLCRSVSL